MSSKPKLKGESLAMRKLGPLRPLTTTTFTLLGAALALNAIASCGTNDGGSSNSSSTSASSASVTGGAGGTGGTGGAGATSAPGGSTSTGGSGGAGADLCTNDADCTNDPKGAFCNKATGACVACLPSNDPCGAGQFCDPVVNLCTNGCKSNADCLADPMGTHCNPQTHACVACLSENDCPAGQICLQGNNLCVVGCSPTHGCEPGKTCCGATCYDLLSDVTHCGGCDTLCPPLLNAQGICSNGACQIKQCWAAFADCNGDPTDGCEWNKLQDGPCTCTPGQTQGCYQGAPGTKGVGPCAAGTQTCNPSGTSWGPCIGQVLPAPELCANSVDDDCDGQVDNVVDFDGDGWTLCNGDCCEIAGPGCTNPKLVNPGAYDAPGDGVDNDCDGQIDNTPTTVCSATSKFTGVTGTDVANAMDLCQFTTANPTLAQKKWGVILATQTLANGAAVNTNEAQNSQTAIKTKFGSAIVPKKNATMAVISTGRARDATDTGVVNPWTNPISNSTTFSSIISFSPIPAAPLGTYLNAHGGGLLPGKCGSTTCSTGAGANDSINIRLQIRTPTNAQGLSYDFRFFSAEYQSYQCTMFNDYYLAMLTSASSAIPTDHNISFDALNNAVSVNNGFFQDCGGNSKACGTCPYGTSALVATGFDLVNGGATEWLTTDAPIVPGETITLDLMVFDVQDQIYDTLVLLDNFRWQLTPVTLGTHT